MSTEEKKQLLSITKSGSNINVEVNQDNLAELQALAKEAADNPEIKSGLADMFRNIVKIEGSDASSFSDETGSVTLHINVSPDDYASHYSAGVELLTSAVAGFAAQAIEHGLSEASVLEQLIERFAAAMTDAIPSVKIMTMGDVPFNGPGPGNSGSSHLLS